MYCAAGNLTTATVDAQVTSFIYDADDRLTNSTSGSVETTYTNDAYGRRTSEVTSGGSTSYSWDAMGHLTSVEAEDATSNYSYGATGMREYASVTQGGTATWTKSFWLGATLTAELDSNGTRYDYLWRPDGTPLALSVTPQGQGASVYHYQTDAHGSVVAITDATGDVVASYTYGAYGEVLSVTGGDLAERNPLRYRGYHHDTVTGLYYLPARYYDPATCRFLSPDPASPSAGDPLTLNAYVYCVGDPVNLEDPSGAVIDADADGRVSVADLYTHNYIHETDVVKKAARRHAMRCALANSVTGTSQSVVANLAAESLAAEMGERLPYRADYSNYWGSMLSLYPTAPTAVDGVLDTWGCYCELGGPGGVIPEGAGDVVGSVYVLGMWVVGKKSLGDVGLQALDLVSPGGGVSFVRAGIDASFFVIGPMGTGSLGGSTVLPAGSDSAYREFESTEY